MWFHNNKTHRTSHRCFCRVTKETVYSSVCLPLVAVLVYNSSILCLYQSTSPYITFSLNFLSQKQIYFASVTLVGAKFCFLIWRCLLGFKRDFGKMVVFFCKWNVLPFCTRLTPKDLEISAELSLLHIAAACAPGWNFSSCLCSTTAASHFLYWVDNDNYKFPIHSFKTTHFASLTVTQRCWVHLWFFECTCMCSRGGGQIVFNMNQYCINHVMCERNTNLSPPQRSKFREIVNMTF